MTKEYKTMSVRSPKCVHILQENDNIVYEILKKFLLQRLSN